jgi:hypothetical protein
LKVLDWYRLLGFTLLIVRSALTLTCLHGRTRHGPDYPAVPPRFLDHQSLHRRRAVSATESASRASPCFDGFSLAVPWRSGRFQRVYKDSRDVGDLADRRVERSLVGLRWSVQPTDLSHELQRSRANLFFGGWRIEVEERSNTPAHDY